MEIEVLFERGDGIYIIKMDYGFYLVNLEISTISERKQYIDSFLKFGYFTPVKNIDVKILDSIKEITALQRYSATAEGTSIIGKMSEEELIKLNCKTKERDIMNYEKVIDDFYKLETNEDGAPLFTQENFKLINTFLKYDSNYNGVEDDTNLVFAKTYGGILTREKDNFFSFKKVEDYASEEEYMKNDSLYLVIESIDRMNSTHLASEGQKGGNRGRIKTAQGVYNIKNFRERLFNADAKLVDEISCFGGKNNFSFASKFCSYLCRYLFKDLPQENNYCIYDEVVQSVLPYFANYYKVDLDKKYYVTYIRNGIKHNHSTVCNVKTCGGYSEYIKLMKAIVEKITEVTNIDVTFEAFDHMLWYFFKGQPNKIQELMDKLPKLK